MLLKKQRNKRETKKGTVEGPGPIRKKHTWAWCQGLYDCLFFKKGKELKERGHVQAPSPIRKKSSTRGLVVKARVTGHVYIF